MFEFQLQWYNSDNYNKKKSLLRLSFILGSVNEKGGEVRDRRVPPYH